MVATDSHIAESAVKSLCARSFGTCQRRPTGPHWHTQKDASMNFVLDEPRATLSRDKREAACKTKPLGSDCIRQPLFADASAAIFEMDHGARLALRILILSAECRPQEDKHVPS